MLKLNIGCGTKLREGYINIDVRKTHPSVVSANVIKLPYKRSTIDEMFAKDVYEHISFRKSQQLLNHWVSLLKPGGKLHIFTPNILDIVDFIFNNKQDTKLIQEMIRRLFGGQEYAQNFHYTAGHPGLMKRFLIKAGIKGSITIKTGVNNGTNMEVVAIK